MFDTDVCIIGAGPYGLSAGMHLKAAGFGVHVFGESMEFWAKHMPAGMLLRSARRASNLSDPNGELTLSGFEKKTGIELKDPLPLEAFVSYGNWFSDRLNNVRDRRRVRMVSRNGSGFRLQLEDRDFICSRHVVLATGVGNFRVLPPSTLALGAQYCTHCYEDVDFQRLRGKDVAVLGGGQSALECAALLQESGADVEIIAREPAVRFMGRPSWRHQAGLLTSMLYSQHDVGPAGISRLVAYPILVSNIPLGLRDKIRLRAIRPVGANWLSERLRQVKITPGRYLKAASVTGRRVKLLLDDQSERFVDHLLCATGYRVDVSRYDFLSKEIHVHLDTFSGYPKLGRGFQTSVQGLHIIGAPAARNFGPLLYFVAGTEFASRELTCYLTKRRSSARVGNNDSRAELRMGIT